MLCKGCAEQIEGREGEECRVCGKVYTAFVVVPVESPEVKKLEPVVPIKAKAKRRK